MPPSLIRPLSRGINHHGPLTSSDWSLLSWRVWRWGATLRIPMIWWWKQKPGVIPSLNLTASKSPWKSMVERSNYMKLPSLKLTASLHLKMDGWKTSFLWDGLSYGQVLKNAQKSSCVQHASCMQWAVSGLWTMNHELLYIKITKFKISKDCLSETSLKHSQSETCLLSHTLCWSPSRLRIGVLSTPSQCEHKQHVLQSHGNRVSFEWAGLGDVSLVRQVFGYLSTRQRGPSKGQTRLNKYRFLSPKVVVSTQLKNISQMRSFPHEGVNI